MTIAHVTAERGYSGGERQVALLIDGLRARGHGSLLLCPPDSESEIRARASGIRCLPIRAGSEWSPRDFQEVTARLRQASPDVVHLHSGRATWLGGLAARRLRLPALTTRRMDRPVRRGWRTRLIYERSVDRVAAISEAVHQRLVDGRVPENRIEVIHSAVAPDRAKTPRDVLRKSLGVEDDTPCLLVAAALVKRKGIDMLLNAISTLVDAGYTARLWIAGDGPDRPSLEQRSSQLGLDGRVRFLGQRDDVGDLLEACDVFVLPSRREGLGCRRPGSHGGRPTGGRDAGGRPGRSGDSRGNGASRSTRGPRRSRRIPGPLDRGSGVAPTIGAAGPERVTKTYSPDTMIDAYERLYSELTRDGIKR
ncbi:MAG: glycosyltransferase [Myxococcales bacterium]|nr:glycosyltransferase [Myxococcales bacterium]